MERLTRFPVSWGHDLARIYEARPRHV